MPAEALDVFRLDVIARELKVVDARLHAVAKDAAAAKGGGGAGGGAGGAGAGAGGGGGGGSAGGGGGGGGLLLDTLKWCRGHVKDVINQCLTETHKLHIGAPTEDAMANGEAIVMGRL